MPFSVTNVQIVNTNYSSVIFFLVGMGQTWFTGHKALLSAAQIEAQQLKSTLPHNSSSGQHFPVPGQTNQGQGTQLPAPPQISGCSQVSHSPLRQHCSPARKIRFTIVSDRDLVKVRVSGTARCRFMKITAHFCGKQSRSKSRSVVVVIVVAIVAVVVGVLHQ